MRPVPPPEPADDHDRTSLVATPTSQPDTSEPGSARDLARAAAAFHGELRVSGRGAWDTTYNELRTRANAGVASDEERALLARRKADVVDAILDADPEELYTVTKVLQPLPDRPLTDPWLPCDACGELVMETRRRRLLGA